MKHHLFRARHAVCAAALLLSLPAGAGTSWDIDGLRVEAINEGRYVNVHVDANRYEGLALDGLRGFDTRRLTVDAASTVGCGLLDDEGPTLCWRSGFIGVVNGQTAPDGTVRVQLYAGSIRQDSITRVITLRIKGGRFQVQSVEPLAQVTP